MLITLRNERGDRQNCRPFGVFAARLCRTGVPMLTLRSLVAAGVVAATIAVAIAHAQSGTIERTAIVRAPAFSGRELTALPTTAWLTNGGDLFNRRYSPLTEITRDNVATLKESGELV